MNNEMGMGFKILKVMNIKIMVLWAFTMYCGIQVPMFQRNLLIPTAGRSKYIASHLEEHNPDVQHCQILKFHMLPSSSMDCKTQQTC
jgi:hypothetical protein